MANVDYNIKLESLPFESFLKTGDLSKSLSSVLPASAEQPQNFMDTALQAFGKYKITPDQSTLSNLIISQAFLGPKTPGFNEKGGLREQLDYASQKKREEADYAQKLGKESAREALLLSSIGKIGPMLSTALGGPSWDTIERNRETGLNAINNIKQSTLQPLSPAQFQPRSYYS